MMKIDLQVTVDKDVAKGELDLGFVAVRACEVVVAHGHCGGVVGVDVVVLPPDIGPDRDCEP